METACEFISSRRTIFLIFLLALPGTANAELSLEDIIAIRQEHEDIMSNSASYVTDVTTRILPENRMYKSIDLYRRRGEKFLHISNWSGDVSNFEDLKEAEGIRYYLTSYDGQKLYRNDMPASFLRELSAGAAEILGDTTSFEEMINEDLARTYASGANERPKSPLPIGQILEGLGGEPPGHFVSDHFLHPMVYLSTGYPPQSWNSMLSNGTARIVSEENGIVEIVTDQNGSVEHILEMTPSLSRREAESLVGIGTLRMKIDATRGCQLLAYELYDNATGRVIESLSDTVLRQDEESGLWFLAEYTHRDTYRQEIENRCIIRDFSLDPFEDSVFEDVWFDEQHVKDDTVGKAFYYLRRDPDTYNEDLYDDYTVLRHEQAMKQVANDILSGGLIVEDSGPIAMEETVAPVRADSNKPLSAPKVGKNRLVRFIVVSATVVAVSMALYFAYKKAIS